MTSKQVLALVLLAGLGCGDDRGAPLQDCFSIADCGDEQICFLGACVDPGFSIQSVYGELTPPNNSPYLTQETPGAVDVEVGFQTLTLRDAVTFSGSVRQGDQAFPDAGTLVARRPSSIPGREVLRQAPVSPEDGFQLRVIPGTYELRFVPAGPNGGSSTAPPKSYGEEDLSNAKARDLVYPEELLVLQGQVRYSDSVGDKVAGALVTAEATDSETGLELMSSVGMTDNDGVYTLYFPAGAQDFVVTVRPGGASPGNPHVPETTVELGLNPSDSSRLQDIILGVGNLKTVSVRVQDDNGAGVSQAALVLIGTVGTSGGTFTARGETDAEGMATLTVVPGDYTATIAPPATGRYGLLSTTVSLTSATEALFVVPRKITVKGRVRSHRGKPVTAARLTLTLRNSPVPRSYSYLTDDRGGYELSVDGTTGTELLYEVTVEPERQSGLPRHRAVLQAASGNMTQDIDLFAPTFVYGRVVAPGGGPLADVNIAFYALGVGETPILVGTDQSSSEGEFAVPLPTP